MKFVHAADIHLDSPLRGLDRDADAPVDEIRAASRHAFRNLVDLCIDEAVAFLILAGDVFDGDWPDMKTGLYFRNEVARLGAASIPVYMIKGNHDAESQIAPHIPSPENLFIFGSDTAETFVFGAGPTPIALHGQSYAQRDEQRNLARDYPKALPGHLNIGVLHTSLAGHPDHDSYASCSLDDLRNKDYAYWALGHVHQFEILAGPDPYIVFPGNLQGRHVRETGPKGCVVVTVSDGGIADVSRRDLDVVRWARIPIATEAHETLESLVTAAAQSVRGGFDRAGGRPLMVRVLLEGETPLHGALRSRREAFVDGLLGHLQDIGGGLIWLESVQDATEPTAAEQPDPGLEIDPTLLTILKRIAEDHGERARLLAEVMKDFHDRMPPNVQDAPEFAALTSEAAARRMLTSVETLVATMLRPPEDADA